MFCKHDWEAIIDRAEPSELQKILSLGQKFSADSLPSHAMQSTHIAILKCKKCGKLDKTVTRI